MAHGFGGVQEGTLRQAAEDFARAGLVAFSFDYRNFGESGGEPRQAVDIRGQLEDWHAAIATARALPGVDPERIALWGSSLGGGHVLAVAGSDHRIAAVVSQVPFTYGMPRRNDSINPKTARQLGKIALSDWLAARRGRPRHYVQAVGRRDELALMPIDRAWEVIQTMNGTTWRNEVAPGAVLDMALWYRPGRSARRIRCPLLLTLAEHDKEVPVAMARKVAQRAPFGEMRRYPCTHFDFYLPEVREAVVRDQVSFLTTHLLGFERFRHHAR
jgi:hypothetical protein